MRVWKRLDTWADEEARSARTYRRLAETAELHAAGNAGLWRDPELQLALDWHDKSQPNETWALRYHPGFAAAMGFLTQSSEAREAKRAERRKAEARARYARRMLWTVAASIGALAWLLVGPTFGATELVHDRTGYMLTNFRPYVPWQMPSGR
jgi:hypothetical protein